MGSMGSIGGVGSMASMGSVGGVGVPPGRRIRVIGHVPMMARRPDWSLSGKALDLRPRDQGLIRVIPRWAGGP